MLILLWNVNNVKTRSPRFRFQINEVYLAKIRSIVVNINLTKIAAKIKKCNVFSIFFKKKSA